MHVAFAYMTAPLLLGQKTVTRRAWVDSHAAKFHAGEKLAAYDRDQRTGGRWVATCEIEKAPYVENTRNMPDADWACEGFRWYYLHPPYIPDWLDARTFVWNEGHPRDGLFAPTRADFSLEAFRRWRVRSEDMYVLRFHLVEVTPAGRRYLEQVYERARSTHRPH